MNDNTFVIDTHELVYFQFNIKKKSDNDEIYEIYVRVVRVLIKSNLSYYLG